MIDYKGLIGEAHIQAAKACAPYGDFLKPKPKRKQHKIALRKKLFKYYKRAKYGGFYSI